MSEPTARESFLKAKAEFYFLVCAILVDADPAWEPDPILVSGLILCDLVGFKKLLATQHDAEAKREVDAMLLDIGPICREVFEAGIPFQAGRVH